MKYNILAQLVLSLILVGLIAASSSSSESNDSSAKPSSDSSTSHPENWEHKANNLTPLDVYGEPEQERKRQWAREFGWREEDERELQLHQREHLQDQRKRLWPWDNEDPYLQEWLREIDDKAYLPRTTHTTLREPEVEKPMKEKALVAKPANNGNKEDEPKDLK
ncbi:hypothetical protein PSACC_02457 [Paramicrosporidium saccamoebae]|uniref:Uncharacterized protein n=1 Tax=Paramicrosporidium saccamoebae TaxID=1246581 RepID=A0A2H9TIZ4_9FUNG|nr:hypothetical protein PSACC_02457 [Paramicrosporidium saccamoebae]